VQSLILPFLAGYLLDSLAQPRLTDAHHTTMVINLLIGAIDSRVIGPGCTRTLRRFPASYNRLVELTREPTGDFDAEARRCLDALVREIEQALD
jgi:hypothetical protein